MSRPYAVTPAAEPDDRLAPERPEALDAVRSLPPRTPYEDAIASILGDVLGCSGIDVQDRLLTLGEVSRAPAVVAQIRRTMGVDIPVVDYVEARTVAGLAAVVAAKSFAARSASRPPVLGPRPSGATALLSFDQRRLWMENQLLPGSIYNVHGRRRITGRLDVPAIEASIRTIIARHETLRTRFPATDDEPVQVVDAPDTDWRIPITDLTAIDGDAAAAARRLLDEELTRPFDLTTGPLIRCLLIRLGENEHAFGVTMHHIVSDAWSIGLFVRELTALYEAGGDPGRARLAPLPVQYHDYAAWQRGWLVGDALEFQVGHWARHLRGAPRALALPTVQRRTNTMRAEAGQVIAELSAAETAALHDLCRTHAVTSFMVLYAVLATLFARWSGQSDIVIGVPVAGRTSRVTDRLIGFFVNMMPLRIDLSDNPTFITLLERVRRVAVDGYAHAEAPMDELVRDLGIVRDPRRTPLFEVVLNVVASPEAENVTRLSIEQMETPSLFSRYDLTLTAQESGGVLRFKLDFPADRFDPPTGRVLLRQFRTLLRAAVADATVRLLDEPAGEPAIAAGVAPTGPTLGRLRISPRVADPNQIAVVDGDGQYSYRWLSVAAERVARELARRGVQAGDRVGVLRRPNATFVAALAGAATADASVTVIETDDPAVTGPLDLTTVLDASPAGPPAAGTIDLSGLMPHRDVTTRENPAEANPAEGGTDVLAAPDWAAGRFGFDRRDQVVVLASRPGHLMSAMVSAFDAGARLVIPDRPFGDDGAALAGWLRKNDITVAYLDPSILRALSAYPSAAGLPSLRCVVIDNVGDLLPSDIVAVRELSPGCRCVSVYRVGADGRPLAAYDVPPGLNPETAPVRVRLGQPLPGQPVALRRRSGQEATIGELAEIWNGPDRTGDLGRMWPDSCLEYAGDSTGSQTVDVMEATCVLRDFPGVRDAFITEVTDGDGATRLLGYVASPDPELDTIAIQHHLKARLPDYLVPRQLIVLDTLPRTPWGGYNLGALPQPECDGTDGDAYAPPRTPMERQLIEILEGLLDIDRVGIYDSFFELGGFSMLATRLITRIRDAFGVQLAVRDVFESPTVDELARLVVRTQVTEAGLDDVEALLAEIEQADEYPVRSPGTT